MSSSKQGFYSKLALSPVWFRRIMNLWPPFWGTRIHIEDIQSDWRYIRMRMKLSVINKNYVGTQFGGGMFAMTDPFFMLMLMNLLGREYLVWDKAARIEFLKPGRSTVYAHFRITDAMLAEVHAATANGEKYEPTWTVDVVDAERNVIARVEKTLYIRKKAPKSTAMTSG
jgi:acyl-coenzyme A thioesterase PaaI-like protein